MVLDVDEERRRISLGMKQVTSNPWETFAAIHKKGDKVSGQIKSITDFGIFIGLDGGIDGLVHLSDISWNTTGEDVVAQLQEGRHAGSRGAGRRSGARAHLLGVKQLEQDPFGQFMAANAKGSIVKGIVKEVDAKGATIELADGIEGYVAARDIANERVDDASQHLKVGDEVEAKFIGMDRKGRTLQLSIKAKDEAEQRRSPGRVQPFGRRCLQRHHQAGRAAARAAGQQVRVSNRTPGRAVPAVPAARPAGCRPTEAGATSVRSRRVTAMTKSELIEILSQRQAHLKARRRRSGGEGAARDDGRRARRTGERIEIRGFGSFSLHYRPPRLGRNPKTGESVALPGKHVPHFKPGKELRERVSGVMPRRRTIELISAARHGAARAVIASSSG